MMASRFALYFPDFVTHLILFVVPFVPPSPTYHSVSDLVQLQPSFGYMLQFGSDDYAIELNTQNEEEIRQFLNSLYRGLTADETKVISATDGIDFDVLPHLVPSKLLTEDDLQYYVSEYSRTGLRGPCKSASTLSLSKADMVHLGNTYRVLYQNFIDETPLLKHDAHKDLAINCPTLFIRAMDDFAIDLKMVEMMLPYIPHLTT
jgi:pimeloyl-ACP methyl ester carboxylesterase